MKATVQSYANTRLTGVLFFLVLVGPTDGVLGNPSSDFDDGTLQDWSAINDPRSGQAFGGDLSVVVAGGNPGGFMKVRDLVSAGGGLVVANTPKFQGDLSIYTEVRWDEFLFDSPPVRKSTTAFLIGSDNTVYESEGNDGPLGPVKVWRARSTLLEESAWTLTFGSMSFPNVLANARLGFNMDVSVTQVPNDESGIDNVLLVPEASCLLMLLAGVYGALGRNTRHRR
jgi:hypothetical protein